MSICDRDFVYSEIVFICRDVHSYGGKWANLYVRLNCNWDFLVFLSEHQHYDNGNDG